MSNREHSDFKRVPAIDKCFSILDLIAGSKKPLGISEISRKLMLNKSTVFNIARTLADLQVLEYKSNGKLAFGAHLYVLGKAAGSRAELIRTVRPYLEKIAAVSNYSAFLGIRWGLQALIIDKVDAAVDIKVSSEVGMRLPLLAGASGKALLSQLSESELDEILSADGLKQFTPNTCIDKHKFKEAVAEVREQGAAADLEEYLEGIIAVAVPVNTHREGLQAAIWAVGLRRPELDSEISNLTKQLKKIAAELDVRFASV